MPNNPYTWIKDGFPEERNKRQSGRGGFLVYVTYEGYTRFTIIRDKIHADVYKRILIEVFEIINDR